MVQVQCSVRWTNYFIVPTTSSNPEHNLHKLVKKNEDRMAVQIGLFMTVKLQSE